MTESPKRPSSPSASDQTPPAVKGALSRVLLEDAVAEIQPLSANSLKALRALARFKPPPDRYPYPEGRAAIAVALFGSRTGENLNVLLSTRSKTLRTYPGQVACPGGRMDPEAFEEVGLPIDENSVRYLTTLPPFLARSLVLVTPVVFFVLDSTLKPELNPAEVEAVFSFPLQGFLFDKVDNSFSNSVPPAVKAGDVPFHTSHEYTWCNVARRFHAFQSSPSPVTGITAEILIDVARIAYGKDPEFQDYGYNTEDRAAMIEEAMKDEQWIARNRFNSRL